MEGGTVYERLDLCVNEDEELGLQKCHMAPEVMAKLQAMVGAFVKFTSGSQSFICSVWPKLHQEENLVEVNRCVQFIKSDKTRKKKQCKQQHSAKVLKTKRASSVKVNVIIDKIENVVKTRKLLKVSRQIHNVIFECIFRLCVAPGFIVDCRNIRYARLNGITAIVILDVDSESHSDTADAYTVEKTTEIGIGCVQSKEWFDQRSVANELKIGGLDSVVNMLTDLIKLPLQFRKQFENLGVDPPRGILLQGPPGCGKTSLVQYVSNICETFLICVNGPEIYGPHPGETESNLRNIFKKAVLTSEEGPCILFIDEIDSVCPRKSGSGGVQESRVTGQFLTLLDGLSVNSSVIVIAATNRPGALDPAVRRPGRLDREVLINVPTKNQRKDILLSHLCELPVSTDLDLDHLSDVTNGYVGADLAALCHEAAYIAINERTGNQTEENKITQEHFKCALKKVCPSLHRNTEAIVDVRPVVWEDIGGLDEVKIQIKQAVEWPLKHPEAFERMGLPSPKGILLYGPPGCCKTTLVRAAATACHTTFLSVSGAQVYSPFVGDAERFISEVFQKARATAPSILFLDEIDSMVGKRSDSGHRGVQERILSTLLNEMDGIGVRLDEKIEAPHDHKMMEGDNKKVTSDTKTKVDNRSVLVVAATNRPDLLDEALVRPGRIDKVVYVPQPDKKAREEILKLYTKTMRLSDVCLEQLAEETDWYTGADLESLCREAALAALTEDLKATTVTRSHFIKALNSVKPSLNEQVMMSESEEKSAACLPSTSLASANLPSDNLPSDSQHSSQDMFNTPITSPAKMYTPVPKQNPTCSTSELKRARVMMSETEEKSAAILLSTSLASANLPSDSQHSSQDMLNTPYTSPAKLYTPVPKQNPTCSPFELKRSKAVEKSKTAEKELKSEVDSFEETLRSKFVEFDTNIKAALYSISIAKKPEEAVESLERVLRLLKASAKKNEALFKEVKKGIEKLTCKNIDLEKELADSQSKLTELAKDYIGEVFEDDDM